jgi:hypothetical protein
MQSMDDRRSDTDTGLLLTRRVMLHCGRALIASQNTAELDRHLPVAEGDTRDPLQT